HPDTAAPQQIALDAQDAEIRPGQSHGRVAVRLDVEQPHAESPHASGETSARLDGDGAAGVEADAAAVKQNRHVAAAGRGHAAEAEQTEVLEEEITLLRKEQAEEI